MVVRPTAVTADLELRLVVPGSASVPVSAGLRYDITDPYAVHVSFRTGGADDVEWTFARQLLSDGVRLPVGDGDVQVWPSAARRGATVCLALSSPSGRALFEIPLGDLMKFLSRTYAAVPIGRESRHVDIDAELAGLLRSRRRL